jgi:hypothetical protein
MALNLPVSPYIVGFPISKPDYFYGRRHQINEFFNVLRGSALRSLRVLGLRRSGKTSFLLHVAHPEVAGPELQNDSRLTIIAYVDLQADIKTPSDFYLAVAEAVACSTPSHPRPQVLDTYPDFRSFSKWLASILAASESLRLVVLVDEFEVLARSLEFGLSFFHSLRALVTRFLPRFAWVTASYSDLYTLSPKDRTSPFFNIFHPKPIILGPLEPGEIERLICDPAESSGVEFSPEEVQAIQDIAGAMPYFLCIVADQWFLTRKPDVPVDQCREKVLALLRSLSQIQIQLDHYWQHLTGQEQDCLCQLALGKSSRGTNQDVEQKLLRFGLLDHDEGGLKVAGEVLRQWIENNHLQRRRQVDPNSVAPFVPIIVEATKFVFNEAGKWIEDIRKQTLAKAPPPKTTLGLPPGTEAQLSNEPVDMQAVAEMMDSSAAEMMTDEIEGLVEQIRIHHNNLIRLQTRKAKYGIDVPVNVEQQIDDESESVVEKTVWLVELLNKVYRG